MSIAFADLADRGLGLPPAEARDLDQPSRARRAKRVATLALRVGQLWLRASAAPPLTRRQRVRLGRAYARALLAALDIRLRVDGILPAPERPVLVVANHVSWLDTYAINCVNGGRFVAKAEVRDWPLIGTMADAFGSLFHVRHDIFDTRRTVDAMVDLLRRGDPVGVFPEATTTPGTRLCPFYPAMFQAAIEAEVPVQPIAISYHSANGAATVTPAYCDDTTLWESIERIIAAPPLTARLSFAPRLDPRGATRRELAERANRSIATLLHLPAPGCTHAPRRFPDDAQARRVA